MSSSKHIAILLPAMRMGGAEKICLNFLEFLKSDYQLTLILNKKEGELLDNVPSCVDIIEDTLLDFIDIVKKDIKELNIKYLLKDFIYYMRIKLGKNTEKNYRYLVSRTPSIEGYYDCAIGYVANVSTQIFCLGDRINANKKIAWIHGETTELKDTDLFSKYYEDFDKIFAVSKVTKEHFISRFNTCESKVDVYYNPINKDEIIYKSNAPKEFEFDNSVVNIVTVGRLSPEKGIDMIPSIVSKLISESINIHWYIVGDGSYMNELKKQIEINEIKSYITLVGNQINPYPFIRSCDIYVQPSYEEGYSTTICEAGILGKAIIGTSTSGGIREQIEDNVSGLIAEPNVDSLLEKIKKLILNDDLIKKLERNVKLKDFSNANEFNKLKNIL